MPRAPGRPPRSDRSRCFTTPARSSVGRFCDSLNLPVSRSTRISRTTMAFIWLSRKAGRSASKSQAPAPPFRTAAPARAASPGGRPQPSERAPCRRHGPRHSSRSAPRVRSRTRSAKHSRADRRKSPSPWRRRRSWPAGWPRQDGWCRISVRPSGKIAGTWLTAVSRAAVCVSKMANGCRSTKSLRTAASGSANLGGTYTFSPLLPAAPVRRAFDRPDSATPRRRYSE